MAEMDENDAEFHQRVTEVMDEFEKETEIIFRQFCQKCDKSGYRIERDEFIDLVMERMSLTFDRFRAEMEQKTPETDITTDGYEKDVIDLAEETKRLIERKVEPLNAENQQTFMGLLKRCTSEMFGLHSNKRPQSVDVNVTNIKSRNDKEAVIVSVEMSSKHGPKNQSRAIKRAKRPSKGKGNKAKMTITAVLEQSTPSGINQQVTITKGKSGSVSISGVSIQQNDQTADQETNKAKSKSDDQIGAEVQPSKEDSLKMDNKTTPQKSLDVFQFIKYRCVHCQDVNLWIETFNAIKDVYAHWLSWHTDPSNVKPFQYFVVEYAACFHCSEAGTCFELIKHHKDCHQTEPFAIVNQCDRKKCALCPYYGTGIIAHFAVQHRFLLKTQSMRHLRSANIPFRLNNAAVEKHLEKRLHKKLKCGCCNTVFETERELRDHHTKCHKISKMTIKEFYDNNNTHLICNCCHIKIDRNLYLGHVENHAFNFKCYHCKFMSSDMIELVKHDKQAHGLMNSFDYRCMQFKNRLKRDYLKTRVIFGNGLVLTKQNLLTTKYDDSKQFDVFVDTLLKIKKERHFREIAK